MTKAQIKKNKIYSPGLIGGEIVYFLEASKGLFFINHEGTEGYVKDNKGQYVKIALQDVIDARFTYLSSFLEKEMEAAIKDELKVLGQKYVETAQKLIDNIEKYEARVNDSYEKDSFNIHSIIFQLQENPEKAKQEYKQRAVDFFNQYPDAIRLKNELKSWVEKEDYESLYRSLNAMKPMGSFNIKEGADLTAFINLFGGDRIGHTVDELVEKGSLYLAAKINVEKKYYPE